MKERSIFSYWWFWILIVGILLILLAALLHLGLKENTTWVWWIFVAGAVLAVLGIILAVVAYYNQPKCIVTEPESAIVTEDHGCSRISDNYPQSSLEKSYIPISDNEMGSPVYSPIGTPSRSSINIPQAQRGFSTTSSGLSSLAPPNLE